MTAMFKNEYVIKLTNPWLCSTVLISLLFPSSHLLASDPPKDTSEPTASSLPREARRFELAGGPTEDDTPGALAGGGYLWRDILVVKRSYRAVGRKMGGATVETIEHSQAYPYVLHDFFGIYGVNQIGKSFDNEEVEQRFVTWAVGDTNTSETICVTLVPKKNDLFAGNIGWYSRVGHELRTVVVYFDQLDGVPVQLIDEFLKLYPSSVKESDFHAETWVTDDVHKWLHLLQLHKKDSVMFQMALSRLAAYDKNFFGNRDAFVAVGTALRAGDMTAVDQAIETLRARAEDWLAQREKSKRQGKRE